MDVAEALKNCLKIDETKGKILEIGGPHVYTVEEIYEIMQEIVNFPCNFVKLSDKVQTFLAWALRSRFFNIERYAKEGIDQVVNKNGSVMTIEDLGIEPISPVIRMK